LSTQGKIKDQMGGVFSFVNGRNWKHLFILHIVYGEMSGKQFDEVGSVGRQGKDLLFAIQYGILWNSVFRMDGFLDSCST
jgi:hypothetical protein